MAEQFLTLMADLDDEAQARLSGWYHSLQEAGFTGIQTSGLPYHISLSTFPLDQEKEAAEIARKAAAEHMPVPVHLSHIGLFGGGKVLFAAPEKNAELAALQEACRSNAPQQYPWTPHTTVLIDEPDIIHAAIPVFVKSFVPFTARITRLHLCAFWPTREIVSFTLKGVRDEHLYLIEPTMEYYEEIRAYRQKFIDSGDSMDGTGDLRRFDDPKEWFDFLAKHKDPKTVPEGRVPATQLIFVREKDHKIVGMLDIRHYLSEYLEKFGGHIGYSVAPGERRKGYATQMLKAALPVCKELGIDKVLITCIKGNEGSKRTILNNGGVYESTVNEPDEKIELEKYWITL